MLNNSINDSLTRLKTRVAPDIIPGPGYEVRFDHLSMHLPHCVVGQEFIVLPLLS